MTTKHDPDLPDAPELLDAFDRLVADEPPFAVPAAVADTLSAGRRDLRRRHVRRRATVAGAVAAVAGLAAAVTVVGPGLTTAPSSSVDTPAGPAARPVAPVPPVRADPPPTNLRLGLTGAGERRIADEMARRLSAAFDGADVTWERTTPRGVVTFPDGRIDGPPRAAIRFLVAGHPGYVALDSAFGRDLFEQSYSCTGWSECVDPGPLEPARSSRSDDAAPDNEQTWATYVADGALSMSLTGTLAELRDRDSRLPLLDGDDLFVRPGDLEEPVAVADVPPGPDAAVAAQLDDLRAAAADWSAELGVGDAVPTFEGELARTRQDYRHVSLAFPVGDRDDGLVVGISFGPPPGPRDDPSCGGDLPAGIELVEPPDTPEGGGCLELPANGGTVVAHPTQGPGVDDVGYVATFLRGSDGAQVIWVADELPDGVTPRELAELAARVGMPVTGR